jgi:hypothetical protein
MSGKRWIKILVRNTILQNLAQKYGQGVYLIVLSKKMKKRDESVMTCRITNYPYVKNISADELREFLKKYRQRWRIELNISDRNISYYLDKILSTDPKVAELHYLAVNIAHLTIALFNKKLHQAVKKLLPEQKVNLIKWVSIFGANLVLFMRKKCKSITSFLHFNFLWLCYVNL